jgi:hypothetical protein
MDLITSPQNQYVKLFRSLATAKGRKEHGLFAIEGVHLVEEMLAAGWRAQVGYVCPELLKNQTLARRLKKSVDMLVEVAAPVFKEMSDTVTPQGIAAVVPLPRHTLETVPAGPGVVLAVHEVRDPGNMGTMIRTADAAGALGVLAVGDCVDFTSPKVPSAIGGSVRGGAGAVGPGDRRGAGGDGGRGGCSTGAKGAAGALRDHHRQRGPRAVRGAIDSLRRAGYDTDARPGREPQRGHRGGHFALRVQSRTVVTEKSRR